MSRSGYSGAVRSWSECALVAPDHGALPARACCGLREGDVLSGVYEIRGLIGMDGGGHIYEAYDRLLDRMVAIRATGQRAVADRLCAEARTLALLSAPGVLDVYAMGSHDGIDYVVMERLFGLTLRERMLVSRSTRPFELDEVVQILLGIARSLAVAHALGIVHRRLTPEGIMLESGNRVVLLAMGMVAPGAPRVGECSDAAPALGSELLVSDGAGWHGPGIDIQALGMLAFEMIVGRPPRDRDEVLTSMENELRQLAAGQYDELPVHLARLVAEMVAENPGKRPGDASVVARWLETLSETHSISMS